MEFARSWSAELLTAPPLIAPARQYLWPMRLEGEEEALERGALRVMVRPADGAAYLLTCALGFSDASLPRGVHACPAPDSICVVAGGYAYVADTRAPEQVTLLGMKPVVQIVEAVEVGLLLFFGFTSVLAWRVDGLAWETRRLSWEGITLSGIEGSELRGLGWDLMRDMEVPFAVDLMTGEHTGGGWRNR